MTQQTQIGAQALIQQAKRHGFGPFRGYNQQLATVTRLTKTQIFVTVNGDATATERRFVRETMVEYGKVDYHTPEVKLILDPQQIEDALLQQANREVHQEKIRQGQEAMERLQGLFGQNHIHHRSAAQLNQLIDLVQELSSEENG